MAGREESYTSTLYDQSREAVIYSISFIKGMPSTVRVGLEVIDFGGGQESKDRIDALKQQGLGITEKNYLKSLVWSRKI